jgi:hypothetical protein
MIKNCDNIRNSNYRIVHIQYDLTVLEVEIGKLIELILGKTNDIRSIILITILSF